MATMYYLFLGILFITVCHIMGTVYCSVAAHRVLSTNPHNPRHIIIDIAQREIGVREATGNNDGSRVEEYLRYTDLGKGYAWCAAFVSWCFGQAGLPEPRNPWSPALFPKAKTYWQKGYRLDGSTIPPSGARGIADIFGIYGQSAQRINHVGLIKSVQGKYIVTIEGNSNNQVASRRRSISTLYALSDWISNPKNQ